PSTTLFRSVWRKRFGQLEAADVKQLRNLQQENSRLKKLLAERDLEIEVMKEITAKKWFFTQVRGRPPGSSGRSRRRPGSRRPPGPGRSPPGRTWPRHGTGRRRPPRSGNAPEPPGRRRSSCASPRRGPGRSAPGPAAQKTA